MKYADYQTFISPSWLQRAVGAKFQGAFGKELDTLLDRVRQAARCGFPDRDNVPSDALPYIGADRMLPRIAGESNAVYAERLRLAWDAWAEAGSYPGLLKALWRAGFPDTINGTVVVQKTKRYAYLSSGVAGTVVFATHGGWVFDSTGPEIWNQFGILFAADIPDLTVGSQKAQTLNDLVRLWKPAKARYMGAQVLVAGPWWDWPPGVAWDDGGRNWGDGTTTGVTRFIPPT